MKSATLPSIRVEPELRDEAQQVLLEGESLSQFVESAVRDSVRRRQAQTEFVARGLASLEAARASGRYVEPARLLGKLEAMLEKARAGAAKPAKKKAARS